ncbi:MAG: polymer-forming cytoskeletal protein [Bacteroidales bacterium]|nr:polymer-forming cytoskeletal protein [Bacteroidales bacterium]
MLKSNPGDSTSRNMIGQGTVIKGDIESKGDLRIDGHLIGTIKSTGKIVVGATGSVEGELFCKQADISGKVDANLVADELTLLKSTAVFSGDLITAKLSIETGAIFSGKCQMKNAGENLTRQNEKKESKP